MTFVGPARVGSTNALLSYLEQFPELSISGCSITFLDDLAFVHLQIAFDRDPSRSWRFEVQESLGRGGSPVEVLGRVLPPLLQANPLNNDPMLAAEVYKRAGDYQVLAGPVLPFVQPRRKRRLAIWFSWQMARGSEGLAVPFAGLASALHKLHLGFPATNSHESDELYDSPMLEYLVCRHVGNGVFRGKGKLSIPYEVVAGRFPSTELETSASRLCVSVEDAWKAELDRNRSAAHVREVTVAWREFWLVSKEMFLFT
jgi:hypothetical protein